MVMGLEMDLFSQDKIKLYDPALDGMKQIKDAVTKAKSKGNHVLNSVWRKLVFLVFKI